MKEEKKYMFIHIPKAAGASLFATFPNERWHNGPFAEQYNHKISVQDRPPNTYPMLEKNSGKLYKEAGAKLAKNIEDKFYTPKLGHLTLEQRFEVGLITPEQFDDYFTFCFVRNPWDRLLSIWLALRDASTYERINNAYAPENRPSKEEFLEWAARPDVFSHGFVEQEPRDLMRVYGDQWYYKRTYVVYMHENKTRCYIPSRPKPYDYITIDGKPYNIRSLPREHIVTVGWGANWFAPQNLYVECKKNNKKVDFVGRYENLENDFKALARELGLPAGTSLPRRNQTSTRRKGRHYTEFYTKEARDIVAEIYADDIEMFGYKFGD